jgi:tetratricopeptide (TPR) repeat protein
VHIRLLSGIGLFCAGLALPIHCSAADSELSPDQLLRAATTSRLTGNYTRASELYGSLIRTLEEAGSTDSRLARSLVGLGGVREAQGKCQQAADLIIRAIHLLDTPAQPRPFLQSESWQALAKAYNCLGTYSKATTSLQHAFDAEQSAPAPRPDRLVEILSSAGAVYNSSGKLAEAQASLERARSVIDRYPKVSPTEAALLLNNLGLLYRLNGRIQDAEDSYRRGLALMEDSSTPGFELEISLLVNIAAIDENRKHHKDAADSYEKAVALLDRGSSLPPRSFGTILQGYAACLRKLGQRDRAKILEARATALIGSQTDGNQELVIDTTQLARNK